MSLDLTGQALDNIVLSRLDAPVGTYRDSDLAEGIFNSETMGDWILCDGRSCAGTHFETLTGKVNVPDMVTNGEFRRQAKAGRTLGSAEADENKSHSHTSNDASTKTGGYNASGVYSSLWYGGTVQRGTSTVGGDEARPKNIACNVYIKVGY